MSLTLNTGGSRSQEIGRMSIDFFIRKGKPCVAIGNFQQFDLAGVLAFREKTNRYAFEYLVHRVGVAFPRPEQRYALNPRHHYYNVRRLHRPTVAQALYRKGVLTAKEYAMVGYGYDHFAESESEESARVKVNEEIASIRRRATGTHNAVFKRAGYKRTKSRYYRARP